MFKNVKLLAAKESDESGGCRDRHRCLRRLQEGRRQQKKQSQDGEEQLERPQRLTGDEEGMLDEVPQKVEVVVEDPKTEPLLNDGVVKRDVVAEEAGIRDLVVAGILWIF